MEDIYESRMWFDTDDKDWKLEIYLIPLGEKDHRVGPIFENTYTAQDGAKRALKTQMKRLQSLKRDWGPPTQDQWARMTQEAVCPTQEK
jgi:hypothetical protein